MPGLHRTLQILISGALLPGLMLCATAATSYAQQAGPVGWDAPVNLSDSPTGSEAPAIVADSSGMVHVFWGEQTDESLNVANAIFYTRWDGQAWSQPHDILMSPEGLRAMAGQPSAVVSPDGRINLAWAGGYSGTIYFSSARADEAISALAWRWPVPVGRAGIGADAPRLALAADGALYLSYVVAMGGEQGIYVSSSEDGGQNWSTPVLIRGSRQGGDRMLSEPRLAAGADGSLHVIWTWANLPETFPPQGVLYSRSTDGGATWAEPLAVATGPYGSSEVAAVGREVHLIWCGTLSDRHKFHQWSQDGGETWSRPTILLEIGGLQGYAGTAVDGAGRLHLAIIGGHPEFGDVLYHMQWNGGSWSAPQMVLRTTEAVQQNLRNAAIAIADGNEAHLVVEYPVPDTASGQGYQMDIYHVAGRIPAPALAAQSLPSVTPLPTGTATPAVAQPATVLPAGEVRSAAATASPTRVFASATRTPDPAGGGAGALVAGMAAAVLVLGLVIAVRVARRGRAGGRG